MLRNYSWRNTVNIDNSSENEEQYHRFLITPEEMFKAERIARAEKLEIIGFYHSHPDHPSKPSDYDREHALPVWSYLIVSVVSGKAAEIMSWLLADDRERFSEEKIR